MKDIKFNEWLKNAIAIWQGEPNDPAWEITDGQLSVHMNISHGMLITESDIEMTKEQAENVFDFAMMADHERVHDTEHGDDDYDIREHGIFGYGY